MKKKLLKILVIATILGINACGNETGPPEKPIKSTVKMFPMDTTNGAIWQYQDKQKQQMNIQCHGESTERWVMAYYDTLKQIELPTFVYYIKENTSGFPKITKIAIAEYSGKYIMGINEFNLTADNIPLTFYVKICEFDIDSCNAKSWDFDTTYIGTNYIYECNLSRGEQIPMDSSSYDSQNIVINAANKGFYNGNLGMDFVYMPRFGFYKFWDYYFTSYHKP